MRHSVLFTTKASIAELDDWLEDNCQSEWQATLAEMDNESDRRTYKIKFASSGDKDRFETMTARGGLESDRKSAAKAKGKGKRKRSSGTMSLALLINFGIAALIIVPAVVYWMSQKEPFRPNLDFQITPLSTQGKSIDMVAIREAAIRQWPYEESMQVGSLKQGAAIKADGSTRTDGMVWYRVVRFGGKPGFVVSSALKKK